MARSHAVIAAQVKGGDALSTARVGGEDGAGRGGRYLEKEARSKGRTSGPLQPLYSVMH